MRTIIDNNEFLSWHSYKTQGLSTIETRLQGRQRWVWTTWMILKVWDDGYHRVGKADNGNVRKTYNELSPWKSSLCWICYYYASTCADAYWFHKCDDVVGVLWYKTRLHTLYKSQSFLTDKGDEVWLITHLTRWSEIHWTSRNPSRRTERSGTEQFRWIKCFNHMQHQRCP